MERDDTSLATNGAEDRKPAIRFLVESALRTVVSGKNNVRPGSRPEWVAHLAEALMAEAEAPYQSVLSSLMANGVSSEEIYQRYVPDTARYLGELWVNDQASFVDVTIGAARLQELFRASDGNTKSNWINRSIPLGHSVLMIIPPFEEHSLGAFVAADDLRRHGLWVHMGIYLERDELAELIRANRFSMLGITLATPESLESAGEMIEFLREDVDHLPPVVIGGRAVSAVDNAVHRCGADHAVLSAREAIDLCGLPSVTQSTGFDEVPS